MKTQRAERTALETLLEQKSSRPWRLVSHDSIEFDPNAGVFYRDRRYAKERILEVMPEAPGKEWVAKALRDFIRIEFGSHHSPKGVTSPPEPLFKEPVIVDWDSLLMQYLNSCERSLVFSGAGSAIARDPDSTIVEKLYAVFTHGRLGNAQNRRNLPIQEFAQMLEAHVAARERLLFVFPGFPFKDQNPFRTLGSPHRPDLAEAALLARLHTLSIAIYQSYQMSSDWLVLTDGSAFSKALRVPESEVGAYHENLLHLRNKLDVGRSVHLVDYQSLCRQSAPSDADWDNTLQVIEDAIAEVSKESGEQLLTNLEWGMRRNVNLNDLREGRSWSEWWAVLHTADADGLPSNLRQVWTEVSEICRVSAVQYAAFNLTAKWFKVDEVLFPSRIRATIHAKPSQIAVPKIGSEFPWNGTAFLGGSRANVPSVSCKALHEIAASGRPIRPYVDVDGQHVLYVRYDD